jgi:hypothetical protein
LLYNAGCREWFHLHVSTSATETFGDYEAKIPKSQDLHYRKWLEVVANVLSINIATHMHLNTNNSIIWTFCYLGVTEARNDSLLLDQALKDPHRIDYVLRHLHRINNAIK